MTGARSIAERMNDNFKVVATCSSNATTLHLSGPLETQDEMDALTEALAIMREWLPTEAREYPSGGLEAICRAMRDAMGDTATDWREYSMAAGKALPALPASAVKRDTPAQEKAG